MVWETGERWLFSLLLMVRRAAQCEVKSIVSAAHRELGHLSQVGRARGGGSGCLNSLSFKSGRHHQVVIWEPTDVFRKVWAFFIHGKCKAGFLVQGGSLALIFSLASFRADSPRSDQSFLFFYILYCACFCVARKECAHFFCVVILC